MIENLNILIMAQAASPSIASKAAEAYTGNDLFWTVAYMLLGIVGLVVAISGLGLVLIYIERKVAAHFQCRMGPMRVGWHGILQSAADGIKLMMKEGIEPVGADKVLFLVAPALSICASLLLLAAIPVTASIHVIDLNVGVVYIAAISGLGILGILLGGWSSNNKWALIGAMRAGAQIISYEVSLTLSLLIIVMFSGTLELSGIIESQQQGWWLWRGHVVSLTAFVIFIIASTAELNRTPFDLAEGESELTGGFHTEYTGIRFSFFFLAEFANLSVFSGLAVTFFLGGWLPFYIGGWDSFNSAMALIPPVIWFTGKASFFIFLLMWIRWTFPRLRMDQLMNLEWKVLLPIGFANLILGACVVLFGFYFFASEALTGGAN